MEVLDTLLGALTRCCAALPDKRTGENGQYSMAEIGLSAFCVFFTQSPSFLAHQRQLASGHTQSNCQTLFGISRIPTDSTSAPCSTQCRRSTSSACFGR